MTYRFEGKTDISVPPLEKHISSFTNSHISRYSSSEAGMQELRGRYSRSKSTWFASAIKHEFKSPNYNTRWSDIIELK